MIDTHASLSAIQYNAFTGGRLVNHGSTQLTLENDFMAAEVENHGTFVVWGPGSFTNTTVNNLSGSFKFQGNNDLEQVAVDNRAQFELNATVSLEDITLTNSGHFKFTAVQTYDGGSVENSGTIEQLAELTFKDTAITNEGTYEWDAGDLSLTDDTVFDNQGIVEITCDKRLKTGGRLGRFDNHGVFRKSATAGDPTQIDVEFNNETLAGGPTASVEVWAGSMWMGVFGGKMEGQFTAGANAVLDFRSGTWQVKGSSAFLGQGIIRISQARVEGTVAGVLLTSSGTLELVRDPLARGELFTVTLASTGTLRLYGGHFKGVTGQINTLEVAGDDEQLIETSDLTLNGTTTWKDGNDIRLTTSILRNRGTFDIANDRTIIEGLPDEPSRFVNEAGTVKKTTLAPGGQTAIDVFFEQAGGTLDLNGRTINFSRAIEQTGASSDTRLNGGTLVVAGTFLVRAGLVSGFGTVQGDLKIDGGTVDLSGSAAFGVLQVTGKYDQTVASTLKVKVGTNQRDEVSAGGKATLAGTLQVTRMPGSTINPGDRHTVVESAVEREGSFGTISGDGTWTQDTTDNKKLTLVAQ